MVLDTGIGGFIHTKAMFRVCNKSDNFYILTTSAKQYLEVAWSETVIHSRLSLIMTHECLCNPQLDLNGITEEGGVVALLSLGISILCSV